MFLFKEIKEKIESIYYSIVYCKVNRNINRKIAEYKYIHIMLNDKFCVPFVEFINNNFNKNEHLFLVKNISKGFPFPTAENVFEISTIYGIDFSAPKIERVITHSLFWQQTIVYWYKHKNIQKEKAYWMIWGGDLYNAERSNMQDSVRRNFKGYISDTDGDCNVVRDKYCIGRADYINAAYTFPVSLEMVNDAIKMKTNHSYIQIQVNNSADRSTLAMMDELANYASKNMKILTILSYGDLQYKNEIIKKGKTIFKDKFEYLDEYLSPQEYAKKIAENDILILNQNRQQGLGNSFVSLAEGVKVFIRSDVTTYRHFNNRGIKVYDTLKIKEMQYNDIITYEEKIKQNNMQRARRFFEDDYLRKKWDPVFRCD